MPRSLFLLYLSEVGKYWAPATLYSDLVHRCNLSHNPLIRFLRQLPPTSETIMATQCDEFEALFEMATYYGVLEREDGHCFRVEATLMSGSYLLAAGALLLALLSSFVMSSDFQYFFDREELKKLLAVEKVALPEEAPTEVSKEVYEKLRPPPVLFTDTFRWLLRRDGFGGKPESLDSIVVQESDASLGKDQEENMSSASSAS
jgi:hypothetical protein